MSNTPILDHKILEILAEQTTPRVIPELIETYLDDAAQRVALIQEAAANKDMLIIGREAHSLKSSSGTYGAMQVCEIARAIELACKKGDSAEALDLIVRLPEISEHSVSALRQAAKEYEKQVTAL